MIRPINDQRLAHPHGYSHALIARGGTHLFLAGQIALDADGTLVGEGDLLAQFAQIMRNLKTILEAAGATPEQVTKLTIYVTDVEAYRHQTKEIGLIYRSVFGNHYPAMTLVEVRFLMNAQALIEVDGHAVVDPS